MSMAQQKYVFVTLHHDEQWFIIVNDDVKILNYVKTQRQNIS